MTNRRAAGHHVAAMVDDDAYTGPIEDAPTDPIPPPESDQDDAKPDPPPEPEEQPRGDA